MKKDWKFGQTEDQTSVREPEKEGAGEVRGWPVPVSLTERTSRTNSENTCWVQASLLYKAWVILGRDGKSFLKELSLIAKKKTGPKFSIFPFSAFPLHLAVCSETIISQSIVEIRVVPWSLCFYQSPTIQVISVL